MFAKVDVCVLQAFVFVVGSDARARLVAAALGTLARVVVVHVHIIPSRAVISLELHTTARTPLDVHIAGQHR
jgi:hypothetical protein